MHEASRTITAFLDGPDSPDISNPIHSTAVAHAYGFKAALVGGVTVYGWCARSVMEAVSDAWLDMGWADVAFRRPVYPGDIMTVRAASSGGFKMTNAAGERCLVGTAGLGVAPWFEEFIALDYAAPEPPLVLPPELTLATAPAGQRLRAMACPYFEGEALTYVNEKQADRNPPWVGAGARIHPGWIAARMTPLLKHSFRYGPSIHARSQILHLAPALVGQVVTVTGRFIRAYEEKGHHYAVFDGALFSESGAELARIRHTTIFRPARRT